MLLKVNVFITSMSAERLWEIDKPLPGQIQISINVNVMGFQKHQENLIESPFLFTVNFTPAIAQITVKGKSRTTGSESELEEVLKTHKRGKPPPASIIQAVSNAAMAETIIASKTLGIPPPLPPIGVPGKKASDDSPHRYTS